MSDDSLKEALQFSATTAVSVLLFLAILVGGGYYLYRWATPRYEDAQRQAYEQSRQHVEGTVEDLMRYRVKYQSVDSGHKQSLRKLILQRAADVDRSALPDRLRRWVDSLRTRQP